jgi:hypothetical protein
MTAKLLDVQPELHAKWAGSNPLGRLGQVHELRGATAWLASDASTFCTGSEFVYFPCCLHSDLETYKCAVLASLSAVVTRPGKLHTHTRSHHFATLSPLIGWAPLGLISSSVQHSRHEHFSSSSTLVFPLTVSLLQRIVGRRSGFVRLGLIGALSVTFLRMCSPGLSEKEDRWVVWRSIKE